MIFSPRRKAEPKLNRSECRKFLFLNSIHLRDTPSELWTMRIWRKPLILEDMTFTVVQYVGTMVKDGGDADCVTEYRRFVKNIKCEDDVFFSPEDLICALDDTCMFAQLFNKATICEL